MEYRLDDRIPRLAVDEEFGRELLAADSPAASPSTMAYALDVSRVQVRQELDEVVRPQLGVRAGAKQQT